MYFATMSLAAAQAANTSLVPGLTTREALSGISGSISLMAWLAILIPQLLLNYQLGNADSVSIAFLALWVVGDACSLIGGIMAGLLPVCIMLSTYFVMQDWLIFAQCLYYQVSKRYKSSVFVIETPPSPQPASERQPLLNPDACKEDHVEVLGFPGYRRPASVIGEPHDAMSKILVEQDKPTWKPWLENSLCLSVIIGLGVVMWFVTYHTGAWEPTPVDADLDVIPDMVLSAEILGYISATCYCFSRWPQIIKNWRHKSCEGLSLLFFLLSTLGNSTYCASILIHSLEPGYLLRNLPWIIGSGGTLFADAVIFLQFVRYGEEEKASDVSSD